MSSRNGTGHQNRVADAWPHNQEAEGCVIGSALIDPDSVHEVAAFLRPEHFFRASFGEAWRAILNLYGAGSPIDGVSVGDEMRRMGVFAKSGGDDTLSEAMASTPSAVNMRHYAGIVREKWVAREIKVSAQAMIDDAVSQTYTSDDLMERAQSALFAISADAVESNTVHVGQAVSAAMVRLEARGDGVAGLSTGLHELDHHLDGLKAGQLVVLAARPSIGKTSIALQFYAHCAVTSREPALYVSLEMDREELAERLLVALSGVSNSRIRFTHSLGAEDIAAIGRADQELRQCPAVIDDTSTVGLAGLMALVRRWKARCGVKLVVVDYLQLVTGDGENRQEEVASIARRLKVIARECRVAVLCLAQLNRQVETREDRRPRLSDLRESGAIEQDADVVLLMHRPDYYRHDDRPGFCELIVAKNRNGSTGSVELRFHKELGTFDPWDNPSFDETDAEF